MLRKVLIANRGEIAVRVIRACKELNIKTVAVYSEIDKDSLHTKLADQAICIGKPAANQSYLNVNNIIEAANVTGADSIHPGFGFLSENAKFAKMCEECNIKFIGPKYTSIEQMGDKVKSKELMKHADIPVIPGGGLKEKSLKEIKEIAKKTGYPIMLKASNGGGGKGIRIVKKEQDLEEALIIVKKEAKQAFNNDDIYLEKYIENPRHIEVQILADEFGNVIHLGERDCTIQRKNQKILEESPSIILDDNLREKISKAAIKAVKASNYINAGTVEFLVDKNKNFYFMEMNTRIQVEHPVTEVLTGIDIVKEQIKIASGEKLSYKQNKINFTGHVIEARVNAENPKKNFMPSPGTITGLNLPGGNGIRIDSGIYAGYTIPPYYDSMLAKIIVHGQNRNEAIAKLKRALEELIVEGVPTNIEFLLKLIEDEDFKKGNYDTAFIEKKFF